MRKEPVKFMKKFKKTSEGTIKVLRDKKFRGIILTAGEEPDATFNPHPTQDHATGWG